MINVIIPASEESEANSDLYRHLIKSTNILNTIELPLVIARKKFKEFINNCATSKTDLDLITQDSMIISYIGFLVEEFKFNSDEVIVNLLLNDNELIVSKFNEQGVLTNWPYGILDSLGELV